MAICKGKLKDKSNCTYTVHKDSPSKRFCKRHDYLEEYTDEMLSQCKHCSDCGRWIFLGEYKTCEKCKKRGLDNREELKKKKATEPDCDACIDNNCKIINKGVNTNKYGKNYCNLHNEKHTWFDELEANDKKPCNNHNRGCPTEEGLEKDSELDQCEYCTNKILKKSREDDAKRKAKRNKAKATGNTCVYCHKIYNDPNKFIDFRGDKTTKCENCREVQRIRDRKSRESGIKKSYPLSESTKLKKKQWRVNNHNLLAEYCLKSRAKRMKELGEEYWKRNADNQKKWRNDNPDKVNEFNKMRRTDSKYKLKYYKDRSKRSNIKWELTDEEAFEYFKLCCYFCGCDCGETGNGIDRLNNKNGYTVNNTVSCCEICNMMKGNLSEYIFIERCRYILSQNGLIDENILCTNIYPLGTCAIYDKYRDTAKKKRFEFKLSKNQYYDLINDLCYICGNETYYRSINGIDRLSSGEGYLTNNVKSCCGECNYLKRNYDYDIFMQKLKDIHINHKIDKQILDNSIDINKDMLTIYLYSTIEGSFVRTNHVIEDLYIGKWNISYDDNSALKMYTDKKANTFEKYLIESNMCKMPYIMLSQSHNKTIDVKPEEVLSLNNPDNARLLNIINNCAIIASINKSPHKLELILSKSNCDIVGIDIQYVKDNFQDKSLSCRCKLCEDHFMKYNTECYCERCTDHVCHSVTDGCYWCSETGWYDKRLLKYPISVNTINGGVSCKYVGDKSGVDHKIVNTNNILTYRKINGSKKHNSDMVTLYRNERGQLSKKDFRIKAKKKMKNRKEERTKNYFNPEWRKIRVRQIVKARKNI